jgi:sterol desaturase/sphingolipid hydroxylase (fatty acid hydroxylase superfamily)
MKSYTSPVIALLGVFVALITLALHPEAQRAPMGIVSEIIDGNVEYFGYGIVFFIVFTLGLPRLFPKRKLAKQPSHTWRQILHEVIFSLSSSFVMIAVGYYIFIADDKFIPNNYADINQYGWPYAIGFTFLLFFLHDTAFYWSHRIMHHKRLFKLFHRVHHDSLEPTPFTTFSFHPLEAVVQNLNSLVPLITMIFLPWHNGSVAVFGLGVTLFNVIGHLGFEIYPKNWHKWPVLRWKTTAYHHYMHHQRSGGNYSLYFRFWDKLCGTEFKDYEARQEALFERDLAAPGKAVRIDKVVPLSG